MDQNFLYMHSHISKYDRIIIVSVFINKGLINCRYFMTKIKLLFVYVIVNRAAKIANLSRQLIFCLHQSLFLYVKKTYALNEIILLKFYRFQENCQNISPIWRIGSIEIH